MLTKLEKSKQKDEKKERTIKELSARLEDYNAKNGDLFYGLSIPRGRFIYKIEKNLLFQGIDTYPIFIDMYNDRIKDILVNNQPFHLLQYLNKEKKVHPPDVIVPKNLRKHISMYPIHWYPLWDDYLTISEKNKKFNLESIVKEIAEKYGSDYYHQWQRYEPKLFWKRGSKLGIEIAASNNKTKIHFILDGLNMEAVVFKSKDLPDNHLKGYGESVTASELRYAYRNRDRLKERIIFYKNGEKSDIPPWKENPHLWEQYKPSVKNTLESKPSTSSSIAKLTENMSKTSLSEKIQHSKQVASLENKNKESYERKNTLDLMK